MYTLPAAAGQLAARFDFTSAFITAAFPQSQISPLTVLVEGIQGNGGISGTVVYSKTISLSDNLPHLVTLDFKDITAIHFTPSNSGGGGQIVLDNVASNGAVNDPVVTTLLVTPQVIDFGTYQVGTAAPSARSISVSSTFPSSGLNFGMTRGSDCIWLNLPTSPRTTPASLSLSINTSTASIGSHTCIITVTSPGVTTNATVTVQLNVVNATATVTSLSPNQVTAGTSAFTLTVIGSGFANGSTVQWNGAALSTNFGSPTQLTATVPAANIASAGTASVRVVNPGGMTSNVLTFTITAATPSITSLSPSTATAGGPAFPLQVSGTGFLSGSTVQWNGVALSTTFGSATQLTATVPAANITSAGTASVSVVNPGGATSNAFTFVITGSSNLQITTASPLPQGSVGVPYSQSLNAIGGAAPYVWSLSSGSLPAGLNLFSSGEIAGTPVGSGTSSFVVRVVDTAGSSATATMMITIGSNQTLTITTAPVLASATVGTPYSQSLTATGGATPYNWSLLSGSLPAGVNLFSDGTVQGTPLAAGSSSFTAQVTDSRSTSATQTLTLTIAAGLSITTASPLPEATAGSPYSRTLSVLGGTGPFTWSIAEGSLPGGLTILSSGEIRGTPLAAGTATFTVRVSDSASSAATKAFTLAVAAGLVRAGSLSQIASGGGWKTSITLVNPTSSAVTMRLSLWADDGSPLIVPLKVISNGAASDLGSTASLERTVQANSSLLIETDGVSTQTMVGWAEVSASGQLTGYAVFRQTGTDGRASEGTAPLERASEGTFVLPFDNTAGFSTGVAIAASSSSSTAITATVRDENGNVLGEQSLMLNARGHTSFELPKRFEVTAGKRGSIEFRSNATSSSITGLGLRFSPFATFTSVPLARPLEAGTLSQIATGDGWKTTMTLLNPSSSPLNVKVSLWGDDGSALSVPVVVTYRGAREIGSAGTMERTLDPFASLIIESEAVSSTTMVGWAEVVSTKPVSGFVIFRQRASGRDSEGTVALENRTQSSFLLPYDNMTGFSTGVALAVPFELGPATVTATLWDEGGNRLGQETISFPARGHGSFELGRRFSATNGKRGCVSFQAPTNRSVTGLGLRFSPFATFTSVPPAEPQ